MLVDNRPRAFLKVLETAAWILPPIQTFFERSEDPLTIRRIEPQAVVANREDPFRFLAYYSDVNARRRFPPELASVRKERPKDRRERRSVADHRGESIVRDAGMAPF